MGTVHDQPARDRCHYNDLEWLSHVKHLSKESGLEIPQVIAALGVLEARRQNAMYLNNGDAWDEQISGLTAAVEGVAQAIEDTARAVGEVAPVTNVVNG